MMTPLPPEAGGDYLAGRMGILAMLAGLAAQEAERGPAARIWENEAIRAVLMRADGYDVQENWQNDDSGSDLGWRALDAANAGLRRALIALHEAAEARADNALQIEILELYRQMAAARRLQLSGG